MIRSSLRALVLPGLAGALLAGCATGYNYRSGPGDYYYGQPEVEYRDYGMYGGYGGYGPGWGWYGSPYPYSWGGGYPYGYWGPPYWEHRHWHRHSPPGDPPPANPPPPRHAPDPTPLFGRHSGEPPRLPGRVLRPVPMPAPRDVAPPPRPTPTPRVVAPPRPMSGMAERERHRKITP